MYSAGLWLAVMYTPARYGSDVEFAFHVVKLATGIGTMPITSTSKPALEIPTETASCNSGELTLASQPIETFPSL